MKRSPLQVGNEYVFPGYGNAGFRVKAIAFPEREDYDGGLPGVSIQWLHGRRESWWYPFYNEALFWSDIRFSNAVDRA